MSKFLLEIYSHCPTFKRLYQMFNAIDDYVSFRYASQFDYSEVHIIRTSVKCYRLIVFTSLGTRHATASYISFRSMRDMFNHLESLGIARLNRKMP